MPTTVTRRYSFEAAHFLPGVPPTHKCSRMHGHNYEVELTFNGEVDGATGFIADFFDIDRIVEPLVRRVDHTILNDTMISNPTAELIGRWFLQNLDTGNALRCVRARVFETKDCWATVDAPE